MQTLFDRIHSVQSQLPLKILGPKIGGGDVAHRKHINMQRQPAARQYAVVVMLTALQPLDHRRHVLELRRIQPRPLRRQRAPVVTLQRQTARQRQVVIHSPGFNLAHSRIVIKPSLSIHQRSPCGCIVCRGEVTDLGYTLRT